MGNSKELSWLLWAVLADYQTWGKGHATQKYRRLKYRWQLGTWNWHPKWGTVLWDITSGVGFNSWLLVSELNCRTPSWCLESCGIGWCGKKPHSFSVRSVESKGNSVFFWGGVHIIIHFYHTHSHTHEFSCKWHLWVKIQRNPETCKFFPVPSKSHIQGSGGFMVWCIREFIRFAASRWFLFYT